MLDADTIKNLCIEYGEAFYLLDAAQFKRNFIELKSAFQEHYSNFNIAYSYKTNYIPQLCKIVNEQGGYAEVVSDMELELALRCRVEPQNIIWNGPIKNIEKVEEFLLLGGTVNIDSYREAMAIKNIADGTEKTINVGIRCNFDVEDGVISRFGIDVNSDEFWQVFQMMNKTANVNLINFQCHFATRRLDCWKTKIKKMLEFLDEIEYIPPRIDVGGGLFGKMDSTLIAQFECEIPDYNQYANVIAKEFYQYCLKRNVEPELVIEPGSALVGDCMMFACRVKTIKHVRSKCYATILGSQKNISMSGVNPPIEVIHMSEGMYYDNLDIVGYTCIEGDVIYRNYCGKLAEEDIVLVGNCGSYSIVMKPPFILPNFPVIEINESVNGIKEIRLIKRAESFDDVFGTYIF